MEKQVTDREVYPTAWIVLFTLIAAFLIWKYLLREPTVSSCWVYRNWKVYCPGCGGTRALDALLHGRFLQSFWYHPAVPSAAVLTVVYMISQTVWRIRGQHGWVLRYDPRWPKCLLWLLAANWIGKNLLLLGLGINL